MLTLLGERLVWDDSGLIDNGCHTGVIREGEGTRGKKRGGKWRVNVQKWGALLVNKNNKLV